MNPTWAVHLSSPLRASQTSILPIPRLILPSPTLRLSVDGFKYHCIISPRTTCLCFSEAAKSALEHSTLSTCPYRLIDQLLHSNIILPTDDFPSNCHMNPRPGPRPLDLPFSPLRLDHRAPFLRHSTSQLTS